MESPARVSLVKRLVMCVLAVGCVAVSFGATAYGAYEINGQAQLRAEEKAAEEAAAAKDPYGLGFVVEDSDKDLEVETYQYGDILKYLFIFGSDYYDLYFDHPADEVTAEGLKELVARNDGIPDEFKGRVYEFIDSVTEKYPDVDLRVLEQNLATIKIVDCPPEVIHAESNAYTAAYYSERDNEIRMSTTNGYAKYTWDYQLLPHELCHAMRRMRSDDDGLDVHIHPRANSCHVVDEAFTSIIAGSLLDYEADELAYQPEVNMVRVMLECVDWYELNDYYKQSLQYFASKLDETCGDHNYAMRIFFLMQAQYDEYKSDEINRDCAAYRPIYDYLVRLYLDEHAYAGMDEEEVDDMIAELTNRVVSGVPFDYGVDFCEFSRFGRQYYAEKFGGE